MNKPTLNQLKFDLELATFKTQNDIENYLNILYKNYTITTSQNVNNNNTLNICFEGNNERQIFYATCQKYKYDFEVTEVKNHI